MAALAVSAHAATPADGHGCGPWAAIGWFTGCDRAADVPSPAGLSITIATTDGELPDRVVDRYLRRHSAELLACHGDAESTLTFTIAPTGHAHSATTSACLAAAIGKITFPSGEDYTRVSVRLRFTTR